MRDDMRASMMKLPWLLVLIVSFAMGPGLHKFGSKWFVHEIDHDLRALPQHADHDRQASAPAFLQGDQAPEPMDSAEHQLLHEAGQFQTALMGPPLERLLPAPERAGSLPEPLLDPPQAEPEPFFRPPRSLVRI